jgi:hypothetical protein
MHYLVLRDPSIETEDVALLPEHAPEGSSSSPSSSSSNASSSSLNFKSLGHGHSALARAKFAVEETLDQMFRLSAFIRKSGIQNRYDKAAAFVDIDRETGFNHTDAFRKFLVALINLRHPHASQTLRDRLVETVSLRQRQFSFSRKQKKDRELKSALTPLVGGASSLPTQSGDSSARKTSLPARSKIMAPQLQTPKNPHSVSFTHDSASIVGRNRFPRKFTAKTSSAGSVIQRHSVNLWVPSPPSNLRHGAKEFECPICYIVQPREKAFGDKWKQVAIRLRYNKCILTIIRQHALKDIRPYICVVDDCQTPYALFQTTSGWLDHMQDEHSFSQWMCTSTSHDENMPFNSAAEFEDHMRTEHSEAFEDCELPMLVESSLVHLPWTETLLACPLCDDSPETGDMDAFTYHITDHLRSLAMIPFLGLNDTEGRSNTSASSDSTVIRSAAEQEGRPVLAENAASLGMSGPLLFLDPPDIKQVQFADDERVDPKWEENDTENTESSREQYWKHVWDTQERTYEFLLAFGLHN